MHNAFCAVCFVIYMYALCQGVLLNYAQHWTWLYKSYLVVKHVQLTKVTGNCQYTNYCIQVVDLHHVPVWTQQKLLLQNTTMIIDTTIIFILANRLGRLSTAGTKVGSHKGKRGNCHFTIVFASIISFRKSFDILFTLLKNSNQTIFL